MAITLRLDPVEARHLADLVAQFVELLDAGLTDDPATVRLAPDAYPGDPEASADFRAVTASGLLDRRLADANLVQATLPAPQTDDQDSSDPWYVELDVPRRDAWLRTLAALRLVVSSRLGIGEEDEHDPEDPRFAVYDWLGYRLDGLIRAAGG